VSGDVTITISEMIVGAWRRRELRAHLRACRVLGAQVHESELWGLLESVITIRAVGTLDQLAPLTRYLRATGSAPLPLEPKED